jgi:hypothetical protein
MLLTATVLLTVAALAIIAALIHEARVARRPNLGWMSTQWLAEHRASHLP